MADTYTVWIVVIGFIIVIMLLIIQLIISKRAISNVQKTETILTDTATKANTLINKATTFISQAEPVVNQAAPMISTLQPIVTQAGDYMNYISNTIIPTVQEIIDPAEVFLCKWVDSNLSFCNK